MPFKYYIAQMPSGSMDQGWLNLVGSNMSQSLTGAPSGSWNLVNVIPMSPLNKDGGGSVMCYFVSGSY